MVAMLRYLNSRTRGRRPPQGGYSFVELVITVGMILIVSTFAMPSFLNYLRSARVRAGAQTISAYLNEGRQLAIKTNAGVCVAHTTSTMQFRTTNCGGATINVAGLSGASGNVRLPDAISLSMVSGSSAIFGQLGNATTSGTYRVTDVPSGRTLNVIVAPSGRICISSTTVCP
jgi:Tfp pilus assembly protein FimT